MKRKILYISGTRADYGLMRSVLRQIHAHPNLSLKIAVAGMHVMEEFGNTIDEIRSDKFPVIVFDRKIDRDNKQSMLAFIGNLIFDLSKELEKDRPDLILVLGDRGEMLAGAVAGAYMGIPVAHLHGGEITSTVDELARHAITKLSHIHLPATKESAERIIRMGENPKNVFVVGAPGIDQIVSERLTPASEIKQKYNLDPAKPFLLMVQHPVSVEVDVAAMQIQTTFEALRELDIQTLVVYPNADAGGRRMIEIINQYSNESRIRVVKSIPHNDYLSLLKCSAGLIGNSSSGIIEAPSFGIPVVNIGSRQQGRQRGENIIDTEYDKQEIIAAIKKILTDHIFLDRIRHGKNPYGDGTCGQKVVDILSTIPLNNSMIQKHMMY